MEALLSDHVFRTSTPAPKKTTAGNYRVASGAELVTTQQCLDRAREKEEARSKKKDSTKGAKQQLQNKKVINHY